MTEKMPCSISDGPQTPEDIDHGHPREPEYNKYDDPYWRDHVSDFLSRDIKMHVCKDGTITYRRPGEKVFNGIALPFFSVDTIEEAKDLQIMLCSLQHEAHPDLPPGEEWYRRWEFEGELDALPALAVTFHNAYMRLKHRG